MCLPFGLEIPDLGRCIHSLLFIFCAGWMGPLFPLLMTLCGWALFSDFPLPLGLLLDWRSSICKWVATPCGPCTDRAVSPQLPSSGSPSGLLTNEVTLREVLAGTFGVTGHGGDKCELHTEQMVSNSCSDVAALPARPACLGSGPK